MARRKPGAYARPESHRTEPREFGPSAAAPEPLTAVREQARADDNETVQWLQSGRFAGTAIFSLERGRLVSCVVHTVLGGG